MDEEGPSSLYPGFRIGGYELVRRIGRGGMAEVWCAKRMSERKASKFVAIKVVADRYMNDPRFQRMFRSEAELSGLLNHVNIVQVFDEGEDAGRSYLVMEWIDGVNLLKVGAALTFIDDEPWRHKIIAYIVGQLLHALGYAHSVTMHDGNPLGIVHRDVSPQNVLISNNGEVKLTDFGVAHHLLEESSGIHVKGKVRYMAPEQLAGKTRDRRLDLYAVGAILHELLDGRRFRHEAVDQRDLYIAVLSGKVLGLSRPVPPELDALRQGLLTADPEARTASADAALELLERYPGYGDARRDLTQLCGGLTGVLRPRVGPGQSTLMRSASPPGAVAAPVAVEEPPLPRPRTLRVTPLPPGAPSEPVIGDTSPWPPRPPASAVPASGRVSSEPDTGVMTPTMVQRFLSLPVESGPMGVPSEPTDSQHELSTLTTSPPAAPRPTPGVTMVAGRRPRSQGPIALLLAVGGVVMSITAAGAYALRDQIGVLLGRGNAVAPGVVDSPPAMDGESTPSTNEDEPLPLVKQDDGLGEEAESGTDTGAAIEDLAGTSSGTGSELPPPADAPPPPKPPTYKRRKTYPVNIAVEKSLLPLEVRMGSKTFTVHGALKVGRYPAGRYKVQWRRGGRGAWMPPVTVEVDPGCDELYLTIRASGASAKPLGCD
jgi:serine/threonine protein kinase